MRPAAARQWENDLLRVSHRRGNAVSDHLAADGLLLLMREKASFIDPECADRFAAYSPRDWDAAVCLSLKTLTTGWAAGKITASGETVAAALAVLLAVSQILNDEAEQSSSSAPTQAPPRTNGGSRR